MYNSNYYDRQSYRYKGYDYASEGWYFITINVYDRKRLFGDIKNGEMFLNKLGEIVHEEWLKTTDIRKNVSLQEFVVMPDHFHALIDINFSMDQENELGTFRSPSQTLGAIVRGFKGAVTKRIKLYCLENKEQFPLLEKVWQRNYYDRVIRDERELMAVKSYIENNPKNWSSK